MSLKSQHSKQTVFKALQWLDQQPDNWSEHIKDTNIAVKMYLKSQKEDKAQVSENLIKEVTPFLQAETIDLPSPKNQNCMQKKPIQCVPDKKAEPPVSLDLLKKTTLRPPQIGANCFLKKKQMNLFPPVNLFVWMKSA